MSLDYNPCQGTAEQLIAVNAWNAGGSGQLGDQGMQEQEMEVALKAAIGDRGLQH